MKALTGVMCRGGEGVTSLSRGRAHPEFFMVYRHGGQGAARSGGSLAINSTPWTIGRRCLRACSVVGEAPQELTAPTVTIRVSYRVNYGEVLRVVGSGKVLGDWSADRGLQLTWTEGDLWTVEVPISAGHYEFKCVVYNQATKSVTRWEDGGNRVLDITAEPGTWDVSCQWGATANMISAFIPKPQQPPPASAEAEPSAAEATTSGDPVAAVNEELPTLMALSETRTDAEKTDEAAVPADDVEAVPREASMDAPARTGGDASDTTVAGTSSSSSSGGGSAVLLLFATVAAAGAVAVVAFLAPGGLDKSVLGARAGVAVSTTLQQSSQAGAQVRAQVQSQLATLAGHVSAVQPAVQAQMASLQGSVTDGLASLQPIMPSSVSYTRGQATAAPGDAFGSTVMGARVSERQG